MNKLALAAGLLHLVSVSAIADGTGIPLVRCTEGDDQDSGLVATVFVNGQCLEAVFGNSAKGEEIQNHFVVTAPTLPADPLVFTSTDPNNFNLQICLSCAPNNGFFPASVSGLIGDRYFEDQNMVCQFFL